MIIKYFIQKKIAVSGFILLSWLWAITPDVWGQQKTVFLIYQPIEHTLPAKVSLTGQHTRIDSATWKNAIQQSLLGLHKKGYLTASVDSVYWKNDTLLVTIYIGEVFRWAALHPGNVSTTVLREIGYHEKVYRKRPVRYELLADLEEKILAYSDNKGYPFATIRLDSVQIEQQTLTASLNYTPGIKILFDTLRITGTARLRQKFLENWLRLIPGQPYSQNRLEQAYQILSQQPYLKMTRAYEVIFKNDRAYVTFFADAVRASEGTGIVGFLPNEQEKGKLLLTGEVNLRLRNLFSSGGTFALNWQQIRKGSPRLLVSYAQPAFLGTPLEVYVGFQLLREDSLAGAQQGFLTLSQQLTTFYNLNSEQKIGVGIERRNSRLADSDTSQTTNTHPQEAGTNWLAYRLFYEFRQVDDFFFPRRGWEGEIGIGIGNKRLTDAIPPGEAPRLSTQFMYKAFLRRYIALGKQSSLLVQLQGGQIFNKTLFRNDLFRVGGLTSLRGFNENFFFASDFALATLEYRFFWEKTSYVFAFYDQAWIQTRLLQTTQSDLPSGIGAGIRFRTQAGIFSLAYALGRSDERVLGLNFSKIHFGLLSIF